MLQQAIEKFREYREVWLGGSNDLANNLTVLKESLDVIDVIKEVKLRRIKKAIPPLFDKVCTVTEGFEMSVEQMNATTETFQITNDLMNKAYIRGDFKNLKEALKVMPDDFQLSSSDSAIQLLRISSESLAQLKKKQQNEKAEESKKHLSIIDEKKEHKKHSSISSNHKKDVNSKENTIQVNNIIDVNEQDGYRGLMNQIAQTSKIDFQAALFNNKDKRMINPNQSINNSTTMLNDSPVVKGPIMNGMKNWLIKKMAGNNEVTKAKLEAARKRRLELTQT